MRAPYDGRPERPFVPFSDLMSKVGYFLFHWSNLERALSEAIREARGASGSSRVVGAFSERLELWRDLAIQSSAKGKSDLVGEIARQAACLRRIRNYIVHGLKGGDSMPATGQGYVECAIGGYDNPTGGSVRYSLDDLEHFAQAADACCRGFRLPDSFNYRLDLRLHDVTTG